MESQIQLTLYQIQSLAVAMGDGLGTHISIYLTIISAYLVASYLVADKLTALQISIATGVYIVAYAFQCIVLIAYFSSISKAVSRINELNPEIAAGFPQQVGAGYIALLIMIAGLIAPLWFMWSVRRGQSR